MSSDTPECEREVHRTRALLQHCHYELALAAALSLSSSFPNDRDALFLTAVAYRFLQRPAEALVTLADLERHHPTYARLHQERGHCYVALRSPGRAIDAFLRAVTLNVSLPGSWQALQALYRFTGQKAYADDASAHLANLAAMPAEIVTAYSMFADGEVAEADALVQRYLVQHGSHVEGMRLLARIRMQMNATDDAEKLLENVLLLAPAHRVARYEYALVLLQRRKLLRARQEIETLLQTDRANRTYRITYGTICVGIGDMDRALLNYRQALRETPDAPDLHLSLAHALKTAGRTQEAITSYRTAAVLRPAFGEAYWSLANLKTYRFTAQEIARMVSHEGAMDAQTTDRLHLCFSLGKAFEDKRDYRRSFEYYERGNRLKKTQTRYRAEVMEQSVDALASFCTHDFFRQRYGFGAKDTSPIFIVGLPRSGSTLIEQILASHSEVEGTMELAEIPRLAEQLLVSVGTAKPCNLSTALGRLGAEDCLHLGHQYLTDTQVFRTGRPYFVDKMPNNWLHIGLIRLILPNAKIIDARRDPMACCFGNFKQLFAAGQEFTYSLNDIARHYRCYVRLMSHWEKVLPSFSLRVEHESVVENLEGSVRRILDFCGLRFERGCLYFHKTKRHIHTASSEQVRQPIDPRGLHQWRHFAPWLQPLRDTLELPWHADH